MGASADTAMVASSDEVLQKSFQVGIKREHHFLYEELVEKVSFFFSI